MKREAGWISRSWQFFALESDGREHVDFRSKLSTSDDVKSILFLIILIQHQAQ